MSRTTPITVSSSSPSPPPGADPAQPPLLETIENWSTVGLADLNPLGLRAFIRDSALALRGLMESDLARMQGLDEVSDQLAF
jgi:hypothetical protein